MPKQKKCEPLNIFWSVLTNDGAEEIGVVIRTERGFEAYHQLIGFNSAYAKLRDAQKAVHFRRWREVAA